MNKRKKLGVIGIDSGQAIICDPSYLSSWKDGLSEDWHLRAEARINHEETKFPFSYEGSCMATQSNESGGQLYYDVGHPGAAVAFQTGLGDGSYPVYATYDKDGRIKKIEIVFIPYPKD